MRNAVIKIIARLPKNNSFEGQKYPQLWHSWPRWTKRIRWVHRLKTWACGKITGHEWSLTETGTHGNGTDKWCRWCDAMVTMPRSEAPLNDPLKAIPVHPPTPPPPRINR